MQYSFPSLGLFVVFLCPLPGVCAKDWSKALAQDVIEHAKSNDRDAILELGKRGDKTHVGLLREKRAKKNKRFGSPASNAQMALAKLGDETELRDIVRQAKSANPTEQRDGIRKLAYVGGDVAIRTLGELLAGETQVRPAKITNPNARGPRGEAPRQDVWYEAGSVMAARALSQVVSDIPPADRDIITDEYVGKWRKWWDAYKKTHEIKDDKGK